MVVLGIETTCDETAAAVIERPEAGPEGAAAFQRHGGQHWSEILRQAKDIGEVEIQACSLSMEMFGLQVGDLDPLVDGQEGVAGFFLYAGGPVTFI